MNKQRPRWHSLGTIRLFGVLLCGCIALKDQRPWYRGWRFDWRAGNNKPWMTRPHD